VLIALGVWLVGSLVNTGCALYQVPFWLTQFLIGPVVIVLGFVAHRYRQRTELTP
jgi:hypothetical protein